MKFKDHFSNQANAYAAYRPHYPKAFFVYLASLCDAHELAWDCGTGNGQSAYQLAKYFLRVIANDPSEQQLANAIPHPNIDYVCATAEQMALPPSSVDLVTIAQAIHWFDTSQFYRVVHRTLKPGGVVAVFGYRRMTITPEIDAIIKFFYSDVVGPYWPPERRIIEEGYRTIPFPFDEVAPPGFSMSAEWNFGQVMGYLSTWSAVQTYIRERGCNPLDPLEPLLREAWGDERKTYRIAWPMIIRVGRRG